MKRRRKHDFYSSSNKKIKRKGLPFSGERILHYFLYWFLSSAIFWGLYYNTYSNSESKFITKLSFAILFNFLSSIAAIIISVWFIKLILKWTRRPKKGVSEIIHKSWDPEDVFCWLVEMFLNGLAFTFGILNLLQYLAEKILSDNLLVFILLYVATKIIIIIIAKAMTFILKKNVFVAMGFVILYFIIALISVLKLIEVYVND